MHEKKITALIGESGCSKSSITLAILGLLPYSKISGEILWTPQQAHNDAKKKIKEINLLNLKQEEFCKIRGKEIGIIFQDPQTSLNPLHKIGSQIKGQLKFIIKNFKRF